MAINLKDKVDDISSSTDSAANIINELKTSVASANKADNTSISKLGYLAKK